MLSKKSIFNKKYHHNQQIDVLGWQRRKQLLIFSFQSRHKTYKQKYNFDFKKSTSQAPTIFFMYDKK